MSTNTRSATSKPSTSVSKYFDAQFPDHSPYIRYGFQANGRDQERRLRSAYETIPVDATTASPVYFLSENQIERLGEFQDNPYAIAGDGNIVKEIQYECEDEDRVLYPIYLETDARDDGVGFKTMIDWIQSALQVTLEIDPKICTYWYSGSRSIHAHVPRFATGSTLTDLKTHLDEFCAEEGANLDTCIYSPKQQFRVPGTVHHKSNGAFRKTKIDPTWENDQIIRAAGEATSHSMSFCEVLAETFGQEPTDDLLLSLHSDELDIEVPLIERKDPPESCSPPEMIHWSQYNAWPFSPYSDADDNPRSVAVLRVEGTPFARQDVSIGKGSCPVHALVPAYFYGAVGCNGEFTKAEINGPLQLSGGKRKDYEKWIRADISKGDNIVIIGGRSRGSIIHCVEPEQAILASDKLNGENGSRSKALEFLENEGYDIGSAGKSKSKPLTKRLSKSTRRSGSSSRSTEPTKAQKLMVRANQDGIQTLTHHERIRIACRILLKGWQPAWNWFREQYGSEFKPDVTRTQFKSIVESDDWSDYDHVEIPATTH